MSVSSIAHAALIDHPKVLLVEDNPLIQRIHTELLKNLNCCVAIAVNGTAALRIAASKKFDLILMDIHLPDMSGIEVTKHVRRQGINKTAPIFALTSQNTEKTRRRVLQAGMDGCLTKPTSLHDLKRLLETFSQVKQQHPSLKAMKVGRVLLKPKEIRTLYYLARGMTAKEIGAQLYVSKRTIEHRLLHIKRKFECHTRSQLIGTILDLGFPVTELL